MMQSGFSPGSLVRARGRDWIVLPSHDDGVLRLRPLTRAQADEVGVYLPLEGKQVTSADFAPPSAIRPGDATGVMTLFNAARLSLRSGAASLTWPDIRHTAPLPIRPAYNGIAARSGEAPDCG
jgi:hypothetical protein